ncbi:hypothetical protein [Neobacillus mesonae]|uniref:hypothetical protein n=1 Tax=Neobacillus mesonae TaxID=1193713 RepID=UPI002E1B664A|nr:hypothetical protein [Neobacillus mesonae]
MTIIIEIHYISASGNKVLQQGEFKLTGRKKPEQLALDFWKQIQCDLPYGGEIQKVIAAGENITEKVMELEKTPLD